MKEIDSTLKVGSFLRGDTYLIIRFISSDRIGCTYEAEHVFLEKRVAIKEFFPKDFCYRDEATSHVAVGRVDKKALVENLRSKFIEDVRSLCNLHHSCIMSVSDMFEENGTVYFVLAPMGSRSIEYIINQEGPLDEKRAVGYIIQVAEILKYIHFNNRLHGDINPAKIFLDDNDNVVIGHIRLRQAERFAEIIEEADLDPEALQPPISPYESPELHINSYSYYLAPSADMYSLGATLYIMLTGVTPLDFSHRFAGDELKPLPSRISAGTRNAIAAAMNLSRKKRPQSMSEFLQLLEIH